VKANLTGWIFLSAVTYLALSWWTLSVWLQSSVVMEQDVLAAGRKNARRTIKWAEAEAWWEGWVLVVRSGEERIRVNSAMFGNSVAFSRYVEHQFPGINSARRGQSNAVRNRASNMDTG
jgi:hypothetical protein